MAASQFSFSLWPPSERTRAAVVERMEKTLSSPSVLSKKYGQFDTEQAYSVAKRIEEEAFAASKDAATSESGDNGSHVLQFYSKEISKRMLEAAKSHASNQNTPHDNHSVSQEGAPNPATQASDS
uniref:WPP domain-containing protein n=1 Tax=Araucaria cunninghamii TaxID=56994 RepID=A0A0D6R969_ARACU